MATSQRKGERSRAPDFSLPTQSRTTLLAMAGSTWKARVSDWRSGERVARNKTRMRRHRARDVTFITCATRHQRSDLGMATRPVVDLQKDQAQGWVRTIFFFNTPSLSFRNQAHKARTKHPIKFNYCTTTKRLPALNDPQHGSRTTPAYTIALTRRDSSVPHSLAFFVSSSHREIWPDCHACKYFWFCLFREVHVAATQDKENAMNDDV